MTMDLKEIEKRADTLVFTTPILTEDVEVTGNLFADLYFHTDQADTDLILYVSDLYPDGRSLLITEGGYRLATNHKNCLQGPVKIRVDLAATSMVFAKGHAIRLIISSSNYPKYEINTNCGLFNTYLHQAAAAKNSILTGENYPSQLILPIVEIK